MMFGKLCWTSYDWLMRLGMEDTWGSRCMWDIQEQKSLLIRRIEFGMYTWVEGKYANQGREGGSDKGMRPGHTHIECVYKFHYRKQNTVFPTKED